MKSFFAKYPKVEEAVAACMAADTYAFDLETNSFDPIHGRIIGFSVAVDTETVPANCWHKCCQGARFPKSWYFQFVPELNPALSYEDAVANNDDCVPFIQTWRAFRPVFDDPKKRVVKQNGKFDYKFEWRAGVHMKNDYVDTAVAAWMCDENRGTNKLKDLAKLLLGHDMVRFDELGGLFSPPIELYGADDACQTLRLWRLFEKELAKQGLTKVFHELECQIVPILAQMELTGCALDVELLDSLRDEIDAELADTRALCYSIAGREFNIGSAAELNTVLFKEQGWKPRGKLKETIHGYSTDKSTLERYEMDKPLAAAILPTNA